jgi:hypothetical protein
VGVIFREGLYWYGRAIKIVLGGGRVVFIGGEEGGVVVVIAREE